MDKKNIIERHNIFMEDFWEDFYKKLERRNTEKEYDSLFLFEISIQKKRLNRYNEELNPDLYTEDALMISQLKDLIQKLEALYKKFKVEDINSIDFIKLDYGEKNDKVLKLLYKELYGTFIKCSFEEFKLHFKEQEYYTPIQWLESESSISDLFRYQLKLLNDDWASVVITHFINRKGKNYNRNQIVSVSSERAQTNYKHSNIIRKIKEKVSKV